MQPSFDLMYDSRSILDDTVDAGQNLQGKTMMLFAHRGTGVIDENHVVAAISSISDGGFDTVVGDDARHQKSVDAQIAKDLIDRSRVEYARGSFREHNLIFDRLDFIQNFALARLGRSEQIYPLVLDAHVAAVL